MAWDVMSGVTKMAWDVMSGVTKTAWDVLSGVANLCGVFCPGCKKMAWDVLSRDVLSGSRNFILGLSDRFIPQGEGVLGYFQFFIHTSIGSECFFGVQNFEFQYFGGVFRKLNIFGGMKILWIFWGVITKLDYYI